MIPQHVINHWRVAWGWTDDQIEAAKANFAAPLAPSGLLAAARERVQNEPPANECGHVDRVHYAKKMCKQCYDAARRKGQR